MSLDDFAVQLTAIQGHNGDKFLSFFHLLMMKKPLTDVGVLAQLQYPAWVFDTLNAHSRDLDVASLDVEQQVFYRAASEFVDFLPGFLRFDTRLSAVLEQYKPLFLARLLEQPELIVATDSSLAYFVDCLAQLGVGWFDGLEKPPEQLFSRCEKMIVIACECGFDAAKAEIKSLVAEFEQESVRTQRLVGRLLDSETGMARVKRAQHMVINLLNDTIAGAQLPPGVIRFLQEQWINELRLLLIREGVDSKAWLGWQRLLTTLVWVFKGDKNEQEIQRLYKISPSLVSEVESSLLAVNPSAADTYADVLAELEQAQICLLKQALPKLAKAKRLPLPDQEFEVSTSVSRQLIEKIEALQVGDWFSFTTEAGKDIRCQLIAHLSDSAQLLFVNRHGQKALLKDVADLAACWSLKLLKPLPCEQAFTLCLKAFLCDHKEAYLSQARAYIEQKNLAMEAARALELQRQEEERQKQIELEKQQRAIEEARKQAQALALKRQQEEQAAKLKRQQEAQAKAEAEAQNKERMMRLLVDSINIGAWVEVPNKNGERVKAKLAVKMNSTKKFIFVDGVGVKVAEYVRDELIELFVADKASLLEQSGEFEDRLAKVVRGLRKE